MKKAAFISILGLAVVGMSGAQSRSSFSVPTTWTGLIIESTGPKTWNVALSGTPTITWNGNTYDVTDVFGFWLLDNNDDMSAQGQNSGVWNYNENYSGTGGIAGFKTNPNKGITVGNSRDFTFSNVSGSAETFGIHARVSLNNVVETFYFEGDFENPATVPEPATLAVLGIGAAAIARRRRTKR